MTSADLTERLSRFLASPSARRDREIFGELNPTLRHPPRLKAPPLRHKPAAVLLPIVATPSGPGFLMTLRPRTMTDHGGEISFPGGKVQPEDRDRVQTALREAEEEVGIGQGAVTVLGSLGTHFSGLGYAVTPVVGLVREGTPIIPCPTEVDATFILPLSIGLDPDRHLIENRMANGIAYRMFAVPYQDEGQSWHIWGLTAGILNTLARGLTGHRHG